MKTILLLSATVMLVAMIGIATHQGNANLLLQQENQQLKHRLELSEHSYFELSLIRQSEREWSRWSQPEIVPYGSHWGEYTQTRTNSTGEAQVRYCNVN